MGSPFLWIKHRNALSQWCSDLLIWWLMVLCHTKCTRSDLTCSALRKNRHNHTIFSLTWFLCLKSVTSTFISHTKFDANYSTTIQFQLELLSSHTSFHWKSKPTLFKHFYPINTFNNNNLLKKKKRNTKTRTTILVFFTRLLSPTSLQITTKSVKHNALDNLLRSAGSDTDNEDKTAGKR